MDLLIPVAMQSLALHSATYRELLLADMMRAKYSFWVLSMSLNWKIYLYLLQLQKLSKTKNFLYCWSRSWIYTGKKWIIKSPLRFSNFFGTNKIHLIYFFISCLNESESRKPICCGSNAIGFMMPERYQLKTAILT